MKKNRVSRVGLVILLVCSLIPVSLRGQAGKYSQTVAQAEADLSAGNAAQALTECQKAITINPRGWQAYVVAGGALQVEQQYDKAIEDFTQALKLAPESKQAAVKGLLEKCMKAQIAAQSTPAPTSTASTPAPQPASEASVTQAEVVLWKTIQNSTNPSDFQAYLRQYPNGAFAPLAQDSLMNLQKSALSIFQDGQALEKANNFAGACEDYSKAANQGYAPAQASLGWFYYWGHGVTTNYETAREWWHKAADQGNVVGEEALGWDYNMSKDYADAIVWYRKAAEKGEPRSQRLLAEVYGEVQDMAQEANWYSKASEQGSPIAMASLGEMYANGQGVPEDDAAAYVWESIAVQLMAKSDLREDYKFAQATLAQVTAKMSPEQIAEAKQKKSHWLAQGHSIPESSW